MTVDTPASPRRVRRAGWGAFIWPGLVFLALMFVYPFAETAWRSLTDPGPENYDIFRTDPVYLRSLVTTFLTAVIVTVTALVIAYPYAYVMYRAGPKLRVLLTILVLLPFFTSLLVRTYAWTVWLQQTGIINNALLDTGIIDEPLSLMRNTLGVTVGMTHALLPFMVFPIFASMLRIPKDLMPAARTLGAGEAHAFRTVFVPLSLPGIVSGSLIVFVMSLGYYVTPALLGSPDNAMLSELIVNQVETQLAFGVGAAIGVVLLVATFVVLAIGSRLVGFRSIASGGR
ncbi:MAG TPA: ABC transporter permease [Nocardioidaceae bacterium]|nr:ABC transporter permease [Nocardioidaceae bacterium]